MDYLRERNARLREERWKDLELILLLESAHRWAPGDAGNGLKRRLELALVQQPELAQVSNALTIENGVLKDPTHAARVWAQRDRRIRRQLRPDGVNTIEHQFLSFLPAGI